MKILTALSVLFSMNAFAAEAVNLRGLVSEFTRLPLPGNCEILAQLIVSDRSSDVFSLSLQNHNHSEAIHFILSSKMKFSVHDAKVSGEEMKVFSTDYFVVEGIPSSPSLETRFKVQFEVAMNQERVGYLHVSKFVEKHFVNRYWHKIDSIQCE